MKGRVHFKAFEVFIPRILLLNMKEINNLNRLLVREILNIYNNKREEIKVRLRNFRDTWEKGDEWIYKELIFCLLTPQSRAKICWEAVERLFKKNLYILGSPYDIVDELRGIRFKRKKSNYIVYARHLFIREGKIVIKSKIKSLDDDQIYIREWLVKNVKGMGYKEAGHFLRNIGKGSDLAILDRHILKNLYLAGVIEEIPTNLSKSKYANIEKKMKNFSKYIGIPMDYLDLILWYKETGEIFK